MDKCFLVNLLLLGFERGGKKLDQFFTDELSIYWMKYFSIFLNNLDCELKLNSLC